MFQLNVGVVAMNPVPWRLEENFTRLLDYARQAAARQAQVVVAPESALDGYVCGADPDVTLPRMLEVAQTLPDSPYLARAADCCRELGIYLVFGLLERAGSDLFNACVMLDPQGQLLATYRKIHPTNEFGITPGQTLAPVDTPLGRTGFLICNDASVPENFSALATQQVELIFLPNNGGVNRRVAQMLRQRAQDHACWIIQANTTSSVIASARGELYLERYETECVSVQRLDLFDSPRREGPGLYAPSFMGRRPDLYGPITRSTEPLTQFDERGQTTELEQQLRRQWLDQLRQYMND